MTWDDFKLVFAPRPVAEPTGIWRHVKRGSVYVVVGVRRGRVFYQELYTGRRWRRPLAEFMDGRFVQVEFDEEFPRSDLDFAAA